MNYIAIITAGVAGWMFGAVWYGLLAKPWMHAAGLTEEDVKGPSGKPSAAPYVISLLAELIMAAGLLLFFLHVFKNGIWLVGALQMAGMVWVCFIATTITVNHRYGMRPWSLTFIDGFHWLGVLLVQGAVFSAFL
ncbi:MAG: DUF1761 domain-containing protein [Pseudomonadota bacterium]